jgi:O-antigen/teichoic acid export membrane protein
LPDTGVHLAVSRIWRRSWPLALNGLLARASLRVELLVLLAFRGSFEAGLFGVALKLIEPLGAVPAAIGSGALRQLAQEGRRASHDVRTRAVALAAGCGVPAALGLGLLAPGLLQWLGEGYAAALTPLRWLALAVGVMFINAILLHALLALDRGALLARLTAARLLAAGALALLLTPLAGATGAALGFLASEVLLLWLALRACAGAGFPIAVVRPLQSALACSLPMAAVTAVAPLPLPALVVLGVAVYAVTLALAWRGRARAGNC